MVVPLHKAASGGTPEIIKALIASGADIMARDDNGSTPLHASSMKTGQALLALGADVMARDDDGDTATQWHYFLLSALKKLKLW